MDAPTASRTDAPASPRGVAYITVRPYWMSGEFILEDNVPWYRGVERYVGDLEEGLIEPSLRTPDLNYDDYGYALVWKGMELKAGRSNVWEHGMAFSDYLWDHVMQVGDPMEITLVKQERLKPEP